MFAKLSRFIAAQHLLYLQAHATEQLIRLYQQREASLERAAKELEELDQREDYLTKRLTQLAVQQISIEKSAQVANA